jgi:hypothetical protein
MPLDSTEVRGTEKDGRPSNEYCKYCYQGGEFTNPAMSLDEMTTFIRAKMKEMNLPEAIIGKAEETLPHLKRWRKQPFGGIIL